MRDTLNDVNPAPGRLARDSNYSFELDTSTSRSYAGAVPGGRGPLSRNLQELPAVRRVA